MGTHMPLDTWPLREATRCKAERRLELYHQVFVWCPSPAAQARRVRHLKTKSTEQLLPRKVCYCIIEQVSREISLLISPCQLPQQLPPTEAMKESWNTGALGRRWLGIGAPVPVPESHTKKSAWRRWWPRMVEPHRNMQGMKRTPFKTDSGWLEHGQEFIC